MQVIWRQPASVREVADTLNEKREDTVTRTTVLKQMQRLEEKGWIKRGSGERPAKFHSTVPEQRAVRTITHSFRSRVFGGSPIAAVRQLLEGAKLTHAEFNELEAIVREAAASVRKSKP